MQIRQLGSSHPKTQIHALSLLFFLLVAGQSSCLGDNKYRVLILDRLDTTKKPLYIMEGQLLHNEFTYTADQGLYVGGGELSEEMFERYYEGPVDGTYKMWRTNSKITTK